MYGQCQDCLNVLVKVVVQRWNAIRYANWIFWLYLYDLIKGGTHRHTHGLIIWCVSIYRHRFDGHSLFALIFGFWLFASSARVGYDKIESEREQRREKNKQKKVHTKSFELVIRFRRVVQNLASVTFRKISLDFNARVCLASSSASSLSSSLCPLSFPRRSFIFLSSNTQRR